MSKVLLVVGAGFAGTTYARSAAEAGLQVHVIDKRFHVAGNAFDEVAPTGTRIHRYGPHLLHTSNSRVVQWLQRFGTFVDYHHTVEAELNDGRFVPLPINRTTINHVFGTRLQTDEEVRAFLGSQAQAIEAPSNAAEHLASVIGSTLTDLFFRPYTKKMWALDLEDLDAAVVKRIPLRYDEDTRYFPGDAWQALPIKGYTELVNQALDHPRIKVTLGQAFDKSMLTDYLHCFNSMPIDEFFDMAFGPLPYRSIKFHHRDVDRHYVKGQAAVINFTDDRPFTRETDWSRLPKHGASGSHRTITLEEPCDYLDNHLERYYPVKTNDGRYDAVYRRYKALEIAQPTVTFIGRCGTYQYLDMHQVINQSLMGIEQWLKSSPP